MTTGNPGLFFLFSTSLIRSGTITLTKDPTGFRGLRGGAPEEPDGGGGLSDDVRRHHVTLDRVEHPGEGDPGKKFRLLCTEMR